MNAYEKIIGISSGVIGFLGVLAIKQHIHIKKCVAENDKFYYYNDILQEVLYDMVETHGTDSIPEAYLDKLKTLHIFKDSDML